MTLNFCSVIIFSLQRTWKPSSSPVLLNISFFLPLKFLYLLCSMLVAYEEIVLTRTSISFCRNSTHEASLKSNICNVKLFFPNYWRFELARVYCIVCYNFHIISLTVITKFVSTRGYFGVSVGSFLASSVINNFKDVLLHLSIKKHVKSSEVCLAKWRWFISEQKYTKAKQYYAFKSLQ